VHQLKAEWFARLCWRSLINLCGIEILILIHQKALRTYLVEVHDDFIGFYGEFQKDEYGLRKDEAIRYIYHLMINMKGTNQFNKFKLQIKLK
jgi:hypothetical protein